MRAAMVLPKSDFRAFIWVFPIAMAIGSVYALSPNLAFGVVLAFWGLTVVAISRMAWAYALWGAIFGLAVWSYGFNNIPLIRPLPLVDALVFFAVAFSFRQWWPLRQVPAVRRLLTLLLFLLLVVVLRLMVDIPRFGLLAVRDALFVFELWVLMPAIALGFLWGENKIDRYLKFLFLISIAWYLLYPWRELLSTISPVFGIQRPVPLFAFTTAGFVSVLAFFWFLHRRGVLGTLGVIATLVILLLAQSRGTYLAFILSTIVLLLLQPRAVNRWGKLLVASIAVGVILGAVGGSLTGRLGVPIGLDTVIAQLQTLMGEEGPGAGSFRQRLVAWPSVVSQVLSEPLGPVFGVGLGPDLFQGFTLGPDILVRKPHNDFLEIWARLGIFGLLAWVSILASLGLESFKVARRNARHGWILALQITLLITSSSQPAVGFAYITVVWAGLTGVWIGTQIREESLASKRYLKNAHPSHPQPLPPARR